MWGKVPPAPNIGSLITAAMFSGPMARTMCSVASSEGSGPEPCQSSCSGGGIGM